MAKMMKIVSGAIIFLVLLALAGCGFTGENAAGSIVLGEPAATIAYETPTAPNTLMGNASAFNSAFMFYVYDGETVLNRVVFQSVTHRQGIIDNLQNAPAARATGWTLDDITIPIYGIEMGTTCGNGIRAAWSNGFWITDTGDVYRFDFDFGTFIESQRWESPRTHSSFASFPNAIYLTQDENGWRSTLLTPSEELDPPEGIVMMLVSNTGEDVTFTLTNNNNFYWFYGMHFGVNVYLGGQWYDIPTTPHNWGFAGIGLILQAGQTETKTYSLAMYGQLPPGIYRLVKYGVYVVFEI